MADGRSTTPNKMMLVLGPVLLAYSQLALAAAAAASTPDVKCPANEQFRLDSSPDKWWRCAQNGQWSARCYDTLAFQLRALLTTPKCQGHACYVKGSLQYVQQSLQPGLADDGANMGTSSACPQPTFDDTMDRMANVVLQKAQAACLLDIGQWTHLTNLVIGQLRREQTCLESQSGNSAVSAAPHAYDVPRADNNVGLWYQYYFGQSPSQWQYQSPSAPNPPSPPLNNVPVQKVVVVLKRYAYPPGKFVGRQRRECQLPYIVEKTLRVRIAQYEHLIKRASKPLPWQLESAQGIRVEGDPLGTAQQWHDTLRSVSQADWQIIAQARAAKRTLARYLNRHHCRATADRFWRHAH